MFFQSMPFLFSLCLAFAGIAAAHAEPCADNAQALGTSRTLFVDPLEHRHIGKLDYSETLPLDDHEVVLTFDDGPSRKYTPKVLEALAGECVKATFFIVGKMAKDAPDLVQRIQAQGHTIGTHTQSHAHLSHVKERAAQAQILDGIASVAAAAGNAEKVAPFFRFPYLESNRKIDTFALSQGLMIWSVDFTASDWTSISSQHELDLVLGRLEHYRKGIILFHDIKERTAEMLPLFLKELKSRGYRVVHVTPATKDTPKTDTRPEAWTSSGKASAETALHEEKESQ